MASQSTWEMSGGQSHYIVQPNETLDSNGNEIRGRKIDSPHLIVVKEMKETDEDDFGGTEEFLNQFGTGNEELGNFIWNTKEQRLRNELSSRRGQRNSKLSKS